MQVLAFPPSNVLSVFINKNTPLPNLSHLKDKFEKKAAALPTIMRSGVSVMFSKPVENECVTLFYLLIYYCSD